MWITHLLSVSPNNGFATYSNHRSAINSFFRDFQKDLRLEFKNALQECYVGLKKDLNQMDATSVLEITTGKEPMSMTTYRLFCKTMMFSDKRYYIFARNFLIICWNLMCRAGNAESIHFNGSTTCAGMKIVSKLSLPTRKQIRAVTSLETPRDSMQIQSIQRSVPYWHWEFICFCYLPDELSLFPGRSRFVQVLSKIMMPQNQSAAPSDTDETAERHDDHNGMDADQTAVTAHLRSLGL